MRNLTDRIDDIKRMVSTTNQNFKRTLEIIKEMLKNSEFDQVLYGEAKSIEDSINLFETNVESFSKFTSLISIPVMAATGFSVSLLM